MQILRWRRLRFMRQAYTYSVHNCIAPSNLGSNRRSTCTCYTREVDYISSTEFNRCSIHENFIGIIRKAFQSVLVSDTNPPAVVLTLV